MSQSKYCAVLTDENHDFLRYVHILTTSDRLGICLTSIIIKVTSMIGIYQVDRKTNKMIANIS